MWSQSRRSAVRYVFVLILAVCGILFSAEGAAAEVVSSEEWKQNPTGSAGVLEGKSVLVSIYVNDKTTKWTEKGKKEAGKKVNAAAKYIKKQAKRYGKSLELIADTGKYEDIAYECRVSMKVTDSMKSQSALYQKVKKFIDDHIDLVAIREKYGTDSIGFLLHVNKSGNSSTLVHYIEDGSKYFYECSTLFAKYGKKAEGAATYAHEILHLFGARDLYEKNLADGITSSFVKYIAKKYPNEIMYCTYTMDGRMLKYNIKNEIGRVTAYYLGWRKRIPETKTFSLLPVEQKGCFSDGTSKS